MSFNTFTKLGKKNLQLELEQYEEKHYNEPIILHTYTGTHTYLR